ncbi:MAG: hypothetical protein K5905_12000 [Roseibium sp.]|uniref:hypothetical protein n=1 Tax=Roseibium sp. TaxID=1936156 RepID=UPI00262F5FBF|nr:hypothetical protein [Roseibium sp.]MCV0426189.1 hypothetical protein [Roseibium sp.]
MTTQGSVAISDQEWTEIATASANVTAATQSTGSFYAIAATAQPAADTNVENAFFGDAGNSVSFFGISDVNVYARAKKDTITLSVCAS